MDFETIKGDEDDTGYYFNEPPERDIGPDTSRDVILRDLRQMANDYTKTNLGSEMNKMKKLENIYVLTESPEVGSTLKDVEEYKATIKEKKMMLDELMVTNAKLQSMNRKKGPLAITDGSGIDLDGVNDQNIDVKLQEMETRIQEARRVIESRGTDPALAEALQNYHEFVNKDRHFIVNKANETRTMQMTFLDHKILKAIANNNKTIFRVFKQTMDSMENIVRGRPPRTLPRMTSFRQFIEDTEKTLVPDNKRDPEVTKALKELKHLNRYDTLSPNKLPYIPELPYNYEEELAHLNMMSNDILEDIGVQDDVVEIPLSKFLEHIPDVKPAKSIMKKIEASDKKNKSKKKLRKEANKIRSQCEQQNINK